MSRCSPASPCQLRKSAGDKVIGGTLNNTGSFVMTAERVGKETVLAQIVQMVSEAQRSRAPIQRLADKVSGYFVPAVLLAAVATFVGWAWIGPEPRLAHAIVNAVAVLIIACPCALGLATPMSIMVGVGRGAHEGILIKNAEAIEVMEKVTVLVVDKTGTLTEGKPRVTKIITAGGITEDELLAAAATAEQQSEHPLASAIVAGAKNKSLPLGKPHQLLLNDRRRSHGGHRLEQDPRRPASFPARERNHRASKRWKKKRRPSRTKVRPRSSSRSTTVPPASSLWPIR